MDTTHTDKIKKCPQCGTSFTCSPVGCWCSELPAVMPMGVNGSCYCPKCLGEMIDKKLKEKEQ